MLDKKNPEDEPRQKRSFIREKVVKQPLTRRQILFRVSLFQIIAYQFLEKMHCPGTICQCMEPCLRWSAL